MRFWFEGQPNKDVEPIPLSSDDNVPIEAEGGDPQEGSPTDTMEASDRNQSTTTDDDDARALARHGDAIDYLATPAVAAYFDVREHEGYYRALKRVGPRRDFHERLIPVLERFLDAVTSASGMASVDRAMAMASRRRKTGHTPASSLIERARAESPKGVKLLAVPEPVTFDSLKSAYRLAAKRNHPDAGGTHDAMVAVNEAFQLMHDLLREAEIMSDGGVGDDQQYMRVDNDGNLVPIERPRTAADYRYVVGELRFRVALDDWDLEEAARTLGRIRSPDWLESSKYARAENQLLSLTEPAGKLAERLALTPLRAEAEAAIEVARGGLAVAERMELHFEGYVIGAEAALDGGRVPRAVISHPRQAVNAQHLGLIDEAKARRVNEKYAREEGAQVAANAQAETFRETTGFLHELPMDSVARGKIPRSKLVPEPGYYQTRIETLSDDQQGEYVAAFGAGGPGRLVRKYAFVRLVSLLESVALYPEHVDAEAAALEAIMIGTLVRSTYAVDVAATIRSLAGATSRERHERAAVLRDIMAGRGRSQSSGIVVSIAGDGPLGTPLTANYFKVLTCSLDDLRGYRSSGRLLESDRERLDREAWIVEAEWLQAAPVKESEQRAWAADERAKTNPDDGIPDLEAQCCLLLELGKRMTHVEQLLMGFWVDRLTTAQMKAKRPADARAWIERWFALPERYRGRSSESQSERLRTRLARASKARA